MISATIQPSCGLRAPHARSGMHPAARQPAAGSARTATLSRRQPQGACRRQQLAPVVAAAADDGGGSSEAAAAASGVPPGWDAANRISADAVDMIATGDLFAAEIILQKGLAEIGEQHPGDPSAALLHTQLWNLLMEAGQYQAATASAQAAYDLMISYFGEDSADAAFHGIRLGISLVVGGGDVDRAQELLVYGGSCAQHNLELFWNKLQEMEAAGQDAADMAMHTKKLMVSLAECNFYGAIGIVRKGILNADEPELPMSDLEGAWLGGFKQMAMALPPDHALFAVALRELGRLIPEAAGRPTLQGELENVVQGLKDLLYLIKQMPASMREEGPAGVVQRAEEGAAAAAAAAAPEDEFLP